MPDMPSDAPVIRHYIAGGAEHGGGIGRLVGYVLSAGDAGDTSFRHVVVDTRGPGLSLLRSPARLLQAMAVMAADTLRGAPVLHHLHIAGRGSTVRKLVLGAWARRLRAPYVLHLHDYAYADDLARRPRWQLEAIRRLFLGAARVIVLGERDRATVRYALGVPPGRIALLRNCVPDPGPRPPHGTDPQEVGILFLGQLGPRKGVPELLAALADPAMPAEGWHATLAGDGPVAHYRNEVARLGLAGRVALTGWVDAGRAASLREGSDILVLPSHAEGFAMAVLEGLAQGLAVVTTRVGAQGEVLVDGENSLLVPPGDARALAGALSRLVADPALRARLGADGRELFLSRFGMSGYVHALEALQADHLQIGTALPRSA
ncbi:glycosyltransferase family 4 protein [Salipiger mucosus]|uniref:Glycosyltransferase n=1 Tax=Salipiger mucosus DSM 16094 TaxID=1123237 RepID=S9SHF2_9RHOB|nr:glycosyltransferase family 4 protein [Salipiger mucosus]EPX85729.1 Glycosyltransferase [Salipiger mucosus DSM 16094]